jgi:hypothetical protein
MALKYTNIFHFKALQNWPKFGFFVWKYAIWQPWSDGRQVWHFDVGTSFATTATKLEPEKIKEKKIGGDFTKKCDPVNTDISFYLPHT